MNSLIHDICYLTCDKVNKVEVMHKSVPAAPIPLGISRKFFHIVCPRGPALVHRGAFDGLVIFTSYNKEGKITEC